MAFMSESVVDTAIQLPDVAHVPIDLLSGERIANAIFAIASTTAALISLVRAAHRQAQER